MHRTKTVRRTKIGILMLLAALTACARDFDGEEAYKDWTETDSLYGSRHLARKWAAEGFLARIKALINIDMIGDAELDILHDGLSSKPLMQMIWDAAERIGYGKYFTNRKI